MTWGPTAQRRADQFNAMVEDSSAVRDGVRDAELLELVGALRTAPEINARPEFVADLRAQLLAEAQTALVPDDVSKLRLPPRKTTRERRLAAMSGQAGTMAALAQGSMPNTMNAGVRELSAREIEVLRLVADGRSNKAIGQTMGLSALTVKSHLARIARKLGTGDRAGMVAVAMRGGIIA